MYSLVGVTPWQGHIYQRLMSSSFWGEAVQQLSSVQQKATAGSKQYSLIIFRLRKTAL